MNTFKTVVMICAMLSATCSGQYMSQSSGPSYANQGVASSPAFEQQRPSVSSSPALEQTQSSPSAAGSLLGGGVTAPAATHQICSCITINPAAPAASAPATDSFAPSSTPAAAQPQQTFSAPQQSFVAAPQQQQQMQNSFAAPAQQQQAYAPAQSAPAQSNGRY